MARRTPTACVVMEKPATRASPDVGGNSVVSILIVVVLPAPLEPSKPKTSPALTERVRASTAVNEPNRRVRALISRTMSLTLCGNRGTFTPKSLGAFDRAPLQPYLPLPVFHYRYALRRPHLHQEPQAPCLP